MNQNNLFANIDDNIENCKTNISLDNDCYNQISFDKNTDD